MKRLVKTIAFVMICGMLASTSATAQSRGRNNYGNGNSHGSSTTHGRPTTRPGNSGQGSQGNDRPANRPGNGNQGNDRPANGNTNYRPGNGSHGNGYNDYHYGYNDHYNHNHNNYHYGSHYDSHCDHSHYQHYHNHHSFWCPDAPPRGWTPYYGWHPIRTVLGVTFGTAVNYAINSLMSSGYNITSYGSDAIYLNNVQMLNMYWPSATLMFNRAGRLYGSEFVYASQGYDVSRYNLAYTMLASNYGSPVSVNNNGNRIESVWWGPDGQFITLRFLAETGPMGYPVYYTILSFGRQ